jgi:hypothetical protein
MSFLGGHGRQHRLGASLRPDRLSIDKAMEVLRRSNLVYGNRITDAVIASGIESAVADGDDIVNADWLREELELSDVGSRDRAYLVSVFGCYENCRPC